MITLAIDTSHYPLSIALVSENRLIGERTISIKKNHSVRVMPTIQALLKECEVEPEEITKIAVAKGPGSYTGLRIGVTIAKTLAWSYKVPLVGVSSLLAICSNVRYTDAFVCPVFDARRGLVFTGLYSFVDGKPVTVKEDTNVMMSDWLDMLAQENKPVLFVGEDVENFREDMEHVLGSNARFASSVASLPSAAWIAELASSAVPEDIHTFQPFYGRLAEAEAKWQEEQEQQNGN